MGQSNYGHRRWRRARNRVLAEQLICATTGCPNPATVVHHLDGLGLAGPRAYDRTNLIGLCKRCHDKHTAQEQPGGWNATPNRMRPDSGQHPGLI